MQRRCYECACGRACENMHKEETINVFTDYYMSVWQYNIITMWAVLNHLRCVEMLLGQILGTPHLQSTSLYGRGKRSWLWCFCTVHDMHVHVASLTGSYWYPLGNNFPSNDCESRAYCMTKSSTHCHSKGVLQYNVHVRHMRQEHCNPSPQVPVFVYLTRLTRLLISVTNQSTQRNGEIN